MREIKFRAWIDESDLCNREELHNHLTDNDEFVPFMQDLNDWYFDDGQTLGDYFSNFGTGNVMQYTGLEDEEGIEIYEGDIVSISDNLFKVTREIGAFVFTRISDKTNMDECFWNSWNDDIHPLAQYYWDKDCSEGNLGGCFIVGNIYENPELLEEKADE